MKRELLIIDPQNDFVDTPGKAGSLAVPGAYQDCRRLATFIRRMGPTLADIHVTMDTHRRYDVAHPLWWKDPKTGDRPKPFTMITSKEFGKAWVPFDTRSEMMDRMQSYIQALESGGRYPLVIWPEHCLIGTAGHNVQEDVAAAIGHWEATQIADVDFVTKGSNPFTEHYSAVKAEVPDPNDPSTQLNVQLIDILKNADIILIAGQALSHCVANTVRDIADNFGEENIRKMVLLEDCSSNVPGFEQMGKDFITQMSKRGMRVVKSTEYM